ncbi:MAG: hypothetical protein EHM93_12005 [Bacteroidales bacterium]|nr:MAG: hypothetical protein EHM93_12005 [Bacteroidales bacterium]
MRLKYGFFILALVLVNVGFAKADESETVSPKSVKAKPVDEEAPTIVLTSELDNTAQQNIEPIILDTCFYDSGNLNLSFQLNDQPDSTDFDVIKYYIKNVMPLLKKVDSKSFEMIEIL